MFQQKGKGFHLVLILVFLITMVFVFLFRSYEIAVSGMLILIVLTAFIPGWKSTLAAGVISIIVMTGLVIYFKDDNAIMKVFSNKSEGIF